MSTKEAGRSRKEEGEVIQKQFVELKREVDSIKSLMHNRKREGSSCSSGERSQQAHVLEEILKSVKELKQSSSPKPAILRIKKPATMFYSDVAQSLGKPDLIRQDYHRFITSGAVAP